MNRFDIALCLFASEAPLRTIASTNGKVYTGYIKAIEREDGSGRSFNVTLGIVDGRTVTVHIRTED